jgi:hypothetical protein
MLNVKCKMQIVKCKFLEGCTNIHELKRNHGDTEGTEEHGVFLSFTQSRNERKVLRTQR